MTDVTAPAPAEPAAQPMNVISAPENTPQNIGISEAARILQGARKKQTAQPAETPPSSEEPPQTPPLEAEPPAPAEEPISGVETEEQAEPELPTIDPPRFWSSDKKEVFNGLPRDAQEYILEREQARDTETRRGQNEVAEQRKALEAEVQAAQQQRQQYEQALEWTLTNVLQGPDAAQFADIKTPTDARRLASEDPLRYTQYQAWRDEAKELSDQYRLVQQQKQTEQTQQWQTFATKEDALFAEKVPDIANPDKRVAITANTLKYLVDGLGFSEQEIQQAWNTPGWRDHRAQMALYHAAKHWNAERSVKAAPPKPLPKVQRPGVAQGANKVAELHLKALDDKLTQTGNWKDAARLYAERRARKT